MSKNRVTCTHFFLPQTADRKYSLKATASTVSCYERSYETGYAVSLNQTYQVIAGREIFELNWAELGAG